MNRRGFVPRGRFQGRNRGRGGRAASRSVGDYARYRPYCYNIGIVKDPRTSAFPLLMNPVYQNEAERNANAAPLQNQQEVDDAQDQNAQEEQNIRADNAANGNARDAANHAANRNAPDQELPPPKPFTWDYLKEVYRYEKLYYDMMHFQTDSTRLLGKFKTVEAQLQSLKAEKRKSEDILISEIEKLKTELRVMEKILYKKK